MTPAEGRESIQRELEAHGVSRWTTAPPLFRLLWAMGVDIPPPHFLGFWKVALLFGVVFAVVFGAVLYATGWTIGGFPSFRGIGGPAAGGAGFGLAMAWGCRRTREKFRLPSWEEYLRSGKLPDGEKNWDLLPPPGPPTSPPSP